MKKTYIQITKDENPHIVGMVFQVIGQSGDYYITEKSDSLFPDMVKMDACSVLSGFSERYCKYLVSRTVATLHIDKAIEDFEHESVNHSLGKEIESAARALKMILHNTKCPYTACFISESLEGWPDRNRAMEFIYSSKHNATVADKNGWKL